MFAKIVQEIPPPSRPFWYADGCKHRAHEPQLMEGLSLNVTNLPKNRSFRRNSTLSNSLSGNTISHTIAQERRLLPRQTMTGCHLSCKLRHLLLPERLFTCRRSKSYSPSISLFHLSYNLASCSFSQKPFVFMHFCSSGCYVNFNHLIFFEFHIFSHSCAYIIKCYFLLLICLLPVSFRLITKPLTDSGEGFSSPTVPRSIHLISCLSLKKHKKMKAEWVLKKYCFV